MAIVYHFANPDIITMILLGASIFLLIGGIRLKMKRKDIKLSVLFIFSGLITTLWYIIFFFIPAFMFTTVPTAAEVQFGNDYLFVWHKLVPGIILIYSLSINNFIVGMINRKSYGIYLILSGIISFVSILLNIIYPSLPSFVISIIMGISLLLFLYFSIRVKTTFLILFCAVYLFSIVFPLLMPDHYINLF